jgi:hypothetical protein
MLPDMKFGTELLRDEAETPRQSTVKSAAMLLCPTRSDTIASNFKPCTVSPKRRLRLAC